MSPRKAVSHSAGRPGFTLIELVFAMAAFSVMLIVGVSGLLNAMFIYNQSNVSRDNQQQARSIMDMMGRDIRNARTATVKTDPVTGDSLCLTGTTVGNVYYALAPYAANSIETGLRLERWFANDDCTGPVDNTPPQVLTTHGVSVVVDPTPANPMAPGLKLTSILQEPVLVGDTAQQIIRVSLTLNRTSSAAPTKSRQFSNQFQLQTSFLLRRNGS